MFILEEQNSLSCRLEEKRTSAMIAMKAGTHRASVECFSASPPT